MAVSLPKGFVDLSTAFLKENEPHHVIGVCVDFLPATKSRGTDFTIKFTLHDPSWFGGLGMIFRFFHQDEAKLPSIRHNGDVLIIRNVKAKNFQGQRCGMSNTSTTWVVLPGSEIEKSISSDGGEMSFQKSNVAENPTMSELEYAKAIWKSEDPSAFLLPPKATSLQVANIMSATGGTPLRAKEKFSLIESLQTPHLASGRTFVDLLCEVRKIFSADLRVELFVTDYTSHKLLYNYDLGCDEEGTDGDRYGYLAGKAKRWPGPWGRMTLTVTLWDSHATFAQRNVKEGQFVMLRNVRIKFDKSNTKLEGACNGDGVDPNRINVFIQKPKGAESDDRMKALLRRKSDYEKTARDEKLNFVKDPANMKRKGATPVNEEEQSKSKKAKNRNKKQRVVQQTTGDDDGAETNPVPSKVDSARTESKLESSIHVRCNGTAVPLKTIEDIMDPNILKRKSPKGQDLYLPFQNCRYKSKVRVVDYFPRDITDFAAPCRESLYDALTDNESDEDSETEMSQADGTDIQWQWRFVLLVEDSRPRPQQGQEPARMELLIAESDGEYLLDIMPCNLRENPAKLAMLREKLFFLWGDLQERKESAADGATSKDFKPTGRPFECFIKEYGIFRRGQSAGSVDETGYTRMFRLFNTTIK